MMKWLMIGVYLNVRNHDNRFYSSRTFNHIFQVEGDTKEECLAKAAGMHAQQNTAIGAYSEGNAVEWAGPYQVATHEDDYIEDMSDSTRDVELHPIYAQELAERNRLAEIKKRNEQRAKDKQIEQTERAMLARLKEKYND